VSKVEEEDRDGHVADLDSRSNVEHANLCLMVGIEEEVSSNPNSYFVSNFYSSCPSFGEEDENNLLL